MKRGRGRKGCREEVRYEGREERRKGGRVEGGREEGREEDVRDGGTHTHTLKFHVPISKSRYSSSSSSLL